MSEALSCNFLVSRTIVKSFVTKKNPFNCLTPNAYMAFCNPGHYNRLFFQKFYLEIGAEGDQDLQYSVPCSLPVQSINLKHGKTV